ncbi:Inositol phosphatase [Snodgrassella alvi SCGC AB-598-J21]|uniref:Inositol phosphatase n=1 Tax=Snodgrassella alvi SCGC AB-598-J21 TaxID=1385367 RepID=A0A074VY81_9NEIS|nr:Inositol phosphatase [Snodgrassella alvi SCGC AB-598-J21]
MQIVIIINNYNKNTEKFSVLGKIQPQAVSDICNGYYFFFCAMEINFCCLRICMGKR